MTSRRVKQQSGEHASNAIALLRDLVFALDWRAKIKQVRRVVSTVGAYSCRRFPASTTVNMAYTRQTRPVDVAKTFDCDPSMVTQALMVLAHALCMSDNNFTDAIGKELERNPLDTFVDSLAADATQETVTLNLNPFIDSSAARSTCKVWVALQRFSLVMSRSSALGRLRYEPPVRAKVG